MLQSNTLSPIQAVQNAPALRTPRFLLPLYLLGLRRSPLLFRRALPPRLRERQMLQPVLLVIVPRIRLLWEVPIRFSEIFDRGDAAWVVGCYGRAAEALAQDAVAGAEAEGVVG